MDPNFVAWTHLLSSQLVDFRFFPFGLYLLFSCSVLCSVLSHHNPPDKQKFIVVSRGQGNLAAGCQLAAGVSLAKTPPPSQPVSISELEEGKGGEETHTRGSPAGCRGRDE